ncbi:hypothetical protein ACFQ0Q_13590 [Streptomyces aureus]
MVPDADFRTKMATLFAGDDLPDIINIGGGYVLPREAQFVKSRCEDLTEYLSGDAVKDYPNLAGIPTYAWQGMGRISGRIFGVPVERPKPQDTMYFNGQAFTKAGYKPGMSAEDFAAMAKETTTSKNGPLAPRQPPTSATKHTPRGTGRRTSGASRTTKRRSSRARTSSRPRSNSCRTCARPARTTRKQHPSRRWT